MHMSPLKIVSLAVGLIGMFVSAEVQRRETSEIVAKQVDQRIAELRELSSPPTIQ